MNLFDLQASISIAIQNAIDNITILGNHASDLAQTINQGLGGNNEININTSDAQDNVEDLTDEVEDQEEAVDDLSDSHSKLGGVLGGVGKGMVALGGAVVGLTTGFLALAGSTREYREDMGRLDAAFKGANLSAESASSTYRELYSVIGETDTAVEAAQQIALLAASEEEAAKWAELAAAVTGTFGDALMPEAFFESANETLRLGEATGTFVQMLEGTNMSVDEFNKGLAACTTEAEKQAYMLKVSEEAMGDAGKAYKEVNADIMAANDAQALLTETISKFGAVAEPIMTSVKILANDLLEGMLPFVELIGEGLQGAINGTAGATEKLADGLGGIIDFIVDKAMDLLPRLVEVITLLIPSLVNTLLDAIPELLNVVLEILIQLVNMVGDLLPQILIKLSEMLPELILAILDALPLLLDACLKLVQGIVEALPIIITNLINALPTIIDTIINVILEAFPLLIDAAIELFMALVEALPVIIEALTKNLPKVINAIIKGVLDALPLLLEAAIDLFMAIIEALPIIIQLLVIELPKIILTIQKALLDNYPLILRTAFDLFMGIVKAIPQILGSLGKAMGDIVSEIFDSLDEIDLFEVGKELFQGLIDGMLSIGGDIWGAVSELGNDIVDGFKDFFDIHSPSRLVKKEVGMNVGLAVGEGAIESLPEVNKDITEFNDSVYDNLNGVEAPTIKSTSAVTSYDDTKFDRLIDRLDAMEKAILSTKIYLNNDALVGELITTINARLGDLSEATGRGM